MNVQVNKMINAIRDALILEHGYNFLRLSEKDQNALIYLAFVESRKERAED